MEHTHGEMHLRHIGFDLFLFFSMCDCFTHGEMHLRHIGFDLFLFFSMCDCFNAEINVISFDL